MLTAMLLRHIEQSWEYDWLEELFPEPAVIFRNLLWVAILCNVSRGK